MPVAQGPGHAIVAPIPTPCATSAGCAELNPTELDVVLLGVVDVSGVTVAHSEATCASMSMPPRPLVSASSRVEVPAPGADCASPSLSSLPLLLSPPFSESSGMVLDRLV